MWQFSHDEVVSEITAIIGANIWLSSCRHFSKISVLWGQKVSWVVMWAALALSPSDLSLSTASLGRRNGFWFAVFLYCDRSSGFHFTSSTKNEDSHPSLGQGSNVRIPLVSDMPIMYFGNVCANAIKKHITYKHIYVCKFCKNNKNEGLRI